MEKRLLFRKILRSGKYLLPEGKLKSIIADIYREKIVFPHLIKDVEDPQDIGICTRSGLNASRLKFNSGTLKGQEVYFPNQSKSKVIFYSFELPSYFAGNKIPENALIIDAGAYPGDFSIIASRFATKGKVIALEPDLENKSIMSKVIDSNKIGCSIDVIPEGISNVEKYVKMIKGEAVSRILAPDETIKKNIFDAKMTTLDVLIKHYNANNSRPVFIKMDIEGHELEAYKGAREVIAKGATFAIASYHIVNGFRTADVLSNWFKRDNYSSRIQYPAHLVLVASKNN